MSISMAAQPQGSPDPGLAVGGSTATAVDAVSDATRGDMSHPGVRLQRVTDDLGCTLLEIIEAPGPLDAPVNGVTIFDPHDDLALYSGALVLGVGLENPSETAALLRRLGALQAVALVIKEPLQVTRALRRAVHTSGVTLLGLRRAASWFQVAVLLRTLLDRWTVIGGQDIAGNPAGDLFAFANAVSALVDAPITVEDRSSRILAYSARQDEADEPRIQAILGRQVPPQYTRMLEERGVFRDLYQSGGPVWVPSLHAQMLPRVAVAVRAGTEVVGSLWAAVREPPSEERMRALAEAANLGALHMLHARNADLSRQLSADLLESVLHCGLAATEAATRLGLANSRHSVLACQPVCLPGAPFEAASQRLADALGLHLRAMHAGAVVAQIGQCVYAVVPTQGEPDEASQRIRAEAANFVTRIGTREPVVIGIGGPAESLPGLAKARREAERAMRVLRQDGRGRAARFDDVYLETILDQLGEILDNAEQQPRGPVSKLLDYDSANGTELARSLYAYLDAFGDVNSAAATVHVHPNTFRYRLRRVREIGDIDLEDSRARFAALVQLAALRRQPQMGRLAQAGPPAAGQL